MENIRSVSSPNWSILINKNFTLIENKISKNVKALTEQIIGR